MGRCQVTSSVTETFAADANNDTAFERDTLSISRSTRYTTSGDGSADADAPDQCARYFNGQTGAVTVDLNAMTNNNGDTVNFAGIREITLEVSHLLADGSTEAADAAVVIVGAAASTPFVGDWGGTAPTVKVQKGTAKVLHWKPYGTALATSGANNLKLDFGAFTLVAKLAVKGNT